MNTSKRLKDFINNEKIAEDAFLKKLGSVIRGKGLSNSSGDGKSKGKGKYGLQHPDGTPCNAKRPEDCPITHSGKKNDNERPNETSSVPNKEEVAKEDDVSKEKHREEPSSYTMPNWVEEYSNNFDLKPDYNVSKSMEDAWRSGDHDEHVSAVKSKDKWITILHSADKDASKEFEEGLGELGFEPIDKYQSRYGTTLFLCNPKKGFGLDEDSTSPACRYMDSIVGR